MPPLRGSTVYCFLHAPALSLTPPGGLMAEEQTSREVLAQLAARIEHLERLMQAQTARLYQIELRLGLERGQRRPLYESLKDEREEERGSAQTAAPREAARPAGAGEGQARPQPEPGPRAD